jgi:hypothetical protein
MQASRSADAADRASKASERSADAAQVSAASSDRSSKASERSVEVTEKIAGEVAKRAQADAFAKRYQDAATQLGNDKGSSAKALVIGLKWASKSCALSVRFGLARFHQRPIHARIVFGGARRK